jgi:hypothetical protein
MQRWCALLEDEVGSWPNVTSRPMFGLAAFYRGGVIFGAIPRTRAVDTPYSILIKQPGAASARLNAASGPGSKWTRFELASDDDLTEALRWLERAYARAGRARRSEGGTRAARHR